MRKGTGDWGLGTGGWGLGTGGWGLAAALVMALAPMMFAGQAAGPAASMVDAVFAR